jgi:hypothetical protein
MGNKNALKNRVKAFMLGIVRLLKHCQTPVYPEKPVNLFVKAKIMSTEKNLEFIKEADEWLAFAFASLEAVEKNNRQ